MSPEVVVAADLGILALVVWVLDLVRLGRLYVGYGVLAISVLVAAMIVVTVPAILTPLPAPVQALLEKGPLTLAAALLITLLMIYVLHQLTVLSNRIASIAQELAIRSSEQNREGAQKPSESTAVPDRES
jgi:hypothetical protein